MTDERVWKADTINGQVRQDAQRFIEETEAEYHAQIENLAETLTKDLPRRGLILLAGPTAAGKTTTAHGLADALRRAGREVSTVSLDDFYRGYGQAPRLPDGSFDYESIEALDVPLLRQCMTELLSRGSTALPQFDFRRHCRHQTFKPLTVAPDSVVIFEGIHALNPLLEESLPTEAVYKIYIRIGAVVDFDNGERMESRDIRLTRRMLRDLRFRNSTVENTLDMWRQVVRGEELYLFPYSGTARVTLNSGHAYELGMLAGELLPYLRQVSPENPYYATVERLTRLLSQFEPLSSDRLPSDSLLHEFLG